MSEYLDEAVCPTVAIIFGEAGVLCRGTDRVVGRGADDLRKSEVPRSRQTRSLRQPSAKSNECDCA